MTVLQEYLSMSGKTKSAIAREIGVPLQDLSHFLRGENKKVGRAKRKMIRAWMIQKGYLKPNRKREMCVCPVCQARHVMRKNEPRRRDTSVSESDKEQ